MIEALEFFDIEQGTLVTMSHKDQFEKKERSLMSFLPMNTY